MNTVVTSRVKKIPISVKAILSLLHENKLYTSRPTFYKLEERGIFQSERSDNGHRRYTPAQAVDVAWSIWRNYRGNDQEENYRKLFTEYFKQF